MKAISPEETFPKWYKRHRAEEIVETQLCRQEIRKINESFNTYQNWHWYTYWQHWHLSDWFESTAAIAKEKLLAMAKNKEKRPSGTDKNLETRKLSQRLMNYTRKGSDTYDFDFNAKIRALRPDWFKNT